MRPPQVYPTSLTLTLLRLLFCMHYLYPPKVAMLAVAMESSRLGSRMLIMRPADHDLSSGEGDSQLPGKNNVGTLEKHIDARTLKLVDLAMHQRMQASAPRPLGCQGGTCPELTSCEPVLPESASIRSCSNPLLVDRGLARKYFEKSQKAFIWTILDPCPSSPNKWVPGDLISPRCPHRDVQGSGDGRFRGESDWSGQVFSLRNVFINWDGAVFNSTHRFDFGGCSVSPEFVYPVGTKVARKMEVVNLLPSRGSHMMVHREVIEKLPLFFSLAPLMTRLKGALIVLRGRKLLRKVASHILGLELAEQGLQLSSDKHLLFVENLYLPYFQTCNFPSHSMWKTFRARNLLPPSGLPVFNPDWTLREPPAGESEKAQEVPPDWIILITRDSMRKVKEQEEMLQLLETYFKKERVHVYSSNINVQEAKSLFNRAMLFVTVSSIGLTNIMFMPPNSTVLELRPPELSKISTSHDSPLPNMEVENVENHLLARNFADACDIRHFSLICDPVMDALSCDLERFKEVVDKAANPIFLSRTMKAAAAASIGEFRGKIPGSRLRTEEEIENFKGWMGCVSGKGRWVYNPTPRILPWEYLGGMNLCDHRHVRAGEGIAKNEADAIVTGGGSMKEWSIRDSLKYEWQVPSDTCPYDGRDSWMPFDPKTFCTKIGKGRTIMLLGDSLTDQMTSTFINNIFKDTPKPALWALKETIPKECKDWLGTSIPRHFFCKDFTFDDGICPGFKLRFVRNDQLWLDGNERVFDHIPWMRSALINEADVIVANRGAHYLDDADFENSLEKAMQYIRNRFPEKLLIYRNTPPGHADCQNYSGPISKRQDPSILPYNWDKFFNQNKAAEGIAKEQGAIVMDVDTMTALRPDSHKGFIEYTKKYDCLHYCTPGPIDLWVQLLYNILLKLLPPKD